MKTQTQPKPDHLKGRKVFRKLGTCSQTFEYILNREFEVPREKEERAADPLAGGILQLGHQCGMLWGASLAAGAEAYRRTKDVNQASALAIHATQALMESYFKRENTIECREVTRCDFSNKWSFAKYMLSGRFLHCFALAEKWAPEAITAAKKALSENSFSELEPCINCASELAKKMGASEEQRVMVAGFAGGMGLSGNACGALSASIWLRTLAWQKENPNDSTFINSYAAKCLSDFQELMGDKIACAEITEQHFENLQEHSRYIENGGCNELMDVLSGS